jgi:hypothetical protein
MRYQLYKRCSQRRQRATCHTAHGTGTGLLISSHLIIMPETPTLITKRLHISGLTPAISSDDLHRRLGIFGSITTGLDGLGKLDALGQPRNFAHVTLKTTKAQLSRCTPCHSQATQLPHPVVRF